MITKRPSPFLVGIVIGSMLHLLVLPWLSATRAQSAQPPWQDDASRVPATIEHAGLRFATPEGTHELFYEHLLIRTALMGEDFPARGSLITRDSILAAQFDRFTNDTALIPGTTFPGSLITTDERLLAEFYVLTALHLGDERVRLNDTIMPDAARPGDVIDASAYAVSMIVATEFGVHGVDSLVVTSDRGNIVLPTSAMTDDQVTSMALAGATDHYDRFDDAIAADMVLYGAHEYGFRTGPFMYLTENVYQMTQGVAPPSINPLMFKLCNYCTQCDFPVGSPEYETLCRMRELAKVQYNDQINEVYDEFRVCTRGTLTTYGIAVAGALVCLVLSGGTLSLACIAFLLSGAAAAGAAGGCQHSAKLGLQRAKDCLNSRLDQVCIILCTGGTVGGLPSSPRCD